MGDAVARPDQARGKNANVSSSQSQSKFGNSWSKLSLATPTPFDLPSKYNASAELIVSNYHSWLREVGKICRQGVRRGNANVTNVATLLATHLIIELLVVVAALLIPSLSLSSSEEARRKVAEIMDS